MASELELKKSIVKKKKREKKKNLEQIGPLKLLGMLAFKTENGK